MIVKTLIQVVNGLTAPLAMLAILVYHMIHLLVPSMHTKYFDRVSGLVASFQVLFLVYMVCLVLYALDFIDSARMNFWVDLAARLVQIVCSFVTFFLISYVKPFDVANSRDHRAPAVSRRPLLLLPLWQWEMALFLSAVVGFADTIHNLNAGLNVADLSQYIRFVFCMTFELIALTSLTLATVLCVPKGRRVPFRVFSVIFIVLVTLNLVELLHFCGELIDILVRIDVVPSGAPLTILANVDTVIGELRITGYVVFTFLVIAVHVGMVIFHHTVQDRDSINVIGQGLSLASNNFIYREIFK